MVTIAEIAAQAFDGVAAEITDAIGAATLTRTVQGAYDTDTGTYSTTPEEQTGRSVLETTKPINDIFPDYVIGPGDELLFLEGFTSCRENDVLTIGAVGRTVLQVQDILGAGTLFYCVARVVPE